MIPLLDFAVVTLFSVEAVVIGAARMTAVLYMIRYPQTARPFAPVAIVVGPEGMDHHALSEKLLVEPYASVSRQTKWFASEAFATKGAESLREDSTPRRVYAWSDQMTPPGPWLYERMETIDYIGTNQGPEYEQYLPRHRHSRYF